MRGRAWIPNTTAWLSAGALYALLHAWSVAAMIAIPLLRELFERSPRLAILGFLGVALAPVPVAAVVHRFVSGALDQLDVAGRSSRATVESVWAGLHAWFVLWGASTLTTFVLLLIVPPNPDRATFTSLVLSAVDTSNVGLLSLRSAIWLAIAAQLVHLERLAHAPPKS